ncbi:DsbA family protein [Bryobacter aggregatus]|uniref:DsbA family protein n=1 Tax=Bryobacter aggregatus TaxID=360054 RepID=UPI00138E3E6B|nr:thioredoxin domain-containing protein [Bryobacter aggregatus]
MANLMVLMRRIIVYSVLCVAYLPGQETQQCQQCSDVLLELRQLRLLVESLRPNSEAPKTRIVKLAVGNAPMLGSSDAPYTIVNFTDYQCSYCQQFFYNTYPDLKKLLIDTGKVRFFSMDLPLDNHPNAMNAAIAGRCAADQGKFWSLHDIMQSDSQRLSLSELAISAVRIGLDEDKFSKCMKSIEHRESITSSIKVAMSVGANGTPSFIVGRSTKEGVEGELVIGAQAFGTFESKTKQPNP